MGTTLCTKGQPFTACWALKSLERQLDGLVGKAAQPPLLSSTSKASSTISNVRKEKARHIPAKLAIPRGDRHPMSPSSQRRHEISCCLNAHTFNRCSITYRTAWAFLRTCGSGLCDGIEAFCGCCCGWGCCCRASTIMLQRNYKPPNSPFPFPPATGCGDDFRALTAYGTVDSR